MQRSQASIQSNEPPPKVPREPRQVSVSDLTMAHDPSPRNVSVRHLVRPKSMARVGFQMVQRHTRIGAVKFAHVHDGSEQTALGDGASGEKARVTFKPMLGHIMVDMLWTDQRDQDVAIKQVNDLSGRNDKFLGQTQISSSSARTSSAEMGRGNRTKGSPVRLLTLTALDRGVELDAGRVKPMRINSAAV